MNYDDQVRRYFGTSDLHAISASALVSGIEHMRVDLGLEKDQPRRFALWPLLYMLGSAPTIEATFNSMADRTAARNFMDLADGASISK